MMREDMLKTGVWAEGETGCAETDSGWEGRRERNAGKFSRKPEGRQGERRKADPTPAEQRICFISPNRPSLGCLPSPPHRPHSPREDSFQISEEMLGVGGQRLNDSMFSIFEELHSERERKNDLEMRAHRAQIEQLGAQVGSLQAENQALREKLRARAEDSQFLQQFLVEREDYICQLTTSNCRLAEELRAREQQQRELFEEMVKLQELFERQKQELERALQLSQAKCHKLRRQLEQGRQASDSLIAVREVQNTETAAIAARRNAFQSHYPANLQDSPHSDKSDSRQRLTRNSKRERSGCKLPLSPDVLPTQEAVTLAKKTSLGELGSCECHGLVKNLRQKVRYSEIEIDILKRLKLDTQRLADQNEQLKRRNKKLLARIEYLSHNASRRGKSSDSSLELSLSPKRN